MDQNATATVRRPNGDQEFFGETRPLLSLLKRLNKAARPVFDERSSGGTAVDIAPMPWEGEGAKILGELGQLVAVTARAARKRWNPSAQRWETIT